MTPGKRLCEPDVFAASKLSLEAFLCALLLGSVGAACLYVLCKLLPEPQGRRPQY